MAYDEQLAQRLAKILARKKGIEEKKMFGSIGFLLNGNVIVGVWGKSLIARIGLDAYDDALLEPHVGEFDITGRAMKGWVMVDPLGIAADAALKEWVDRAVAFVRTLPPK